MGLICNSMLFCGIWDKQHSFLLVEVEKQHEAEPSAISPLQPVTLVLYIPNTTEKHAITYTNPIDKRTYVPTRNGASEICKSQACFSIFHALCITLFPAWIRPGPVVHNMHESCMIYDSVLEHMQELECFTGTGQAWYRSETCTYMYFTQVFMHNSMHDTGIFHAQHCCIPCMYHCKRKN